MYELDLLRFVAALSVVLFHWTFHGPHVGAAPSSAPWLGPVSRYGYLGVEFFFMISGFVILSTARFQDLRQFLWARALRLYPALWFCCTATTLVGWSLADGSAAAQVGWPQYLKNMTMFSGFFSVPPIDGVYWSLYVELHFYLMVAIIVVLRWFAVIEPLMWAWLGISVVSAFMPVEIVQTWLATKYAAFFISGGVFAQIYAERVTMSRLALLAAAYIWAVWPFALDNSEDFSNFYHLPIRWIVIAIVLTVCFVTLFAIATGRLTALRFRFWLTLGAMTYPLYLLHQNIGYIVLTHGREWVPLGVLLPLCLVTVMATAYCVYIGIERPFKLAMGALPFAIKRAKPVPGRALS